MVAVQQNNPVLLVADVAPRLESELAVQGMSCLVALDQNEAVQRLQATKVPFVVVPSMFGNGYSGVTFAQGVLQYFESQVVLYGNGVDAGALDALLRTGRVAHFSNETDGRVVADFLVRRTRGASSPVGTPLPTFNPQGSPPPSFNPRPATPPPQAGFLSSQVKTQFSAPPVAPGFMPTVPGVAVATTSFPPQPGAFITTPSGGFPAATGFGTVPRPPTIGGTAGVGAPPDPQLAQTLEQMAGDLARTQQEMARLRSSLSQSEQEKAALLVEVEAARRSAMAQVAEVMALSDEGDPISEEIEELRNKNATLEKTAADLQAEANMLRAERDRLVADAAAQSGAVAEVKTRADAGEAQLKELQAAVDEQRAFVEALRLELEREKADAVAAFGDIEQARTELEAARSERDLAKTDAEALKAQLGEIEQKLSLEKSARAEVEQNLMKLRVEIGDTQQKAQGELGEYEKTIEELESAVTKLQAAKAEIEAGLQEQVAQQRAIAETEVQARRDIEAALRTEIEKLRGDVAAARTDATTVRLDLQEAVMRLDETAQTVTALTAERDALRAEAAPLREWANQVVAEHAHQQQELERVRKQASEQQQGNGVKERLAALQQELAQAILERDQARAGARQGGVDGDNPDVEVLLARSRELANLVRALEPFMWGLTQATHFYHKAKVDGADEHLKLLQQLQGVLLRLRDEIAMLDLA